MTSCFKALLFPASNSGLMLGTPWLFEVGQNASQWVLESSPAPLYYSLTPQVFEVYWTVGLLNSILTHLIIESHVPTKQ